MNSFAGMTAIFVIVGLIVAVLWVFLPFAVFGIKDLARDLISQSKRTNELLEKLLAQREKLE